MSHMLRNWLILAGIALLAGCPNGGSRHSAAQPAGKTGQAATAVQPWLSVCLVRTDLGLADGAYVREADEFFAQQAKQGTLTYQPVGSVPQALTQEGSIGEIGLPEAGPGQPGVMTLEQAEALLAQVQPCDLLALSTPYLLGAALERIKAGQLKAGAVLVLDDFGWREPPEPPVPVYRFTYDIQEVAFLSGVAAAASANSGMFVMLASSADLQAQEFLTAARSGAFYWTRGSQVHSAILPAAPDGTISRETYVAALQRLLGDPRSAFSQTCNHFVVALGRTSPTVMYALTQEPTKGYVAGAYADFRQVRPSRVVGSAIKHPQAMLEHLFQLPALQQGLPGLRQALPDGVLRLGLRDGATGISGYDLYGRYNPDASDIRDAVEGTLGSILDGDTSVAEEIERYSDKN